MGFIDLFQERALYAILALLLAALFDLVLSFRSFNTAVPLIYKLSDMALSPILIRLDKTKRGKLSLIFRGFFIQLFYSAIILVLGGVFIGFTHELGVVLILSLTMSPLSATFMALRFYKSLKVNDTPKGELFSLSQTAKINLNVTDRHGQVRELLNWLASSFGKHLIVPIVLYIILGIQGALIYASISVIVWLRGKYGNSKGFAKPSIILLSIISTIPEYMAAVIVSFASYLTPKTHKTESIKALFKNNMTSAEGGVLIYAYAHTLGVTLGGAAQHISGGAIHRQWVGDAGATAKINPVILKKAIYLSSSSLILAMFGLTLLLL